MNSKKCKSCGADVPAEAKFCPECAEPLTPGARQSSKTAVSKKRSNPRRDNLIIIGVIVVVAVGYLIMNRPAPSETPPPAANAQNPHGGDMDAMMGALANMPSDYASLVQMGNESMDHGNYAVAAECYKRALAQEGSSSDVRTDYGACLHGMGLAQRALEEFQKVLDDDPAHTIANYNMGVVFFSIEQSDSAKVYFTKYLKLDPQGHAASSAQNYLKEIGG